MKDAVGQLSSVCVLFILVGLIVDSPTTATCEVCNDALALGDEPLIAAREHMVSKTHLDALTSAAGTFCAFQNVRNGFTNVA